MNYKILGSLLIVAIFSFGCDQAGPESSTGVRKATADVNTQISGLTVEQENVKRRIENENMPGSIKYLYLISTMSGEVIFQSTVKGKVTSSGKRLSPYSIYASATYHAIPIDLGSTSYYTTEVLQDDGTYGSSIPYLYWWDINDVYHQHYVSGGQIIHISSQPIRVSNVTINLDKME